MSQRKEMPVPKRIVLIVASLVVVSYTIAILHGTEKIIWETMMTALYCWYAVCGFHILMLATDFPRDGKPRVIGGILGSTSLFAPLWLILSFPEASRLMALFMALCAVPPLVHAISGRYVFHRGADGDGGS